MDEPRRVLLISEFPLFREGLARVLGETKEYVLIGAAGSVAEAVDVAKDAPPDVIIFDGAGPKADEGDLAALLRLAPSQLVTLSLSDPEMTVISRRQVAKASVEDLLAAIGTAGR